MNTAFERFAPLAACIARETGFGAGVRPAICRRNAALDIERSGRQWLPVSAHINERYLVTYRAPAARLGALVPAPLTVDALDGHGFVSVCALEMDDMGIVGTPWFLRFANRELLYRVGVRIAGQPTFFTWRSDVSSRALAFLAKFSHYRPWRSCFVEPTRRRFDFLGQLESAMGVSLEYDHTLAMTDLRQTWRAARWI